MNEIVEVLNSKGKVIDKNYISIIHQKGLWHKLAVTYIINDKLQILLQRHCKDANIWQASSSQHVLLGEPINCSIARDIENNLGIQINKNKLQRIFTDKNKYKDKNIKDYQFIDFYIIKQNLDIKQINYEDKENIQLKWLSLEKYIEKLKNKDKNYLNYSKKQYKILNTYLLFQKYKKRLK